MHFRQLLQAALLSCATFQDVVSARALAGKPQHFIQPYKRGEPLQDIVTWDEHSLKIRGERVMLFSGEFHPVSDDAEQITTEGAYMFRCSSAFW